MHHIRAECWLEYMEGHERGGNAIYLSIYVSIYLYVVSGLSAGWSIWKVMRDGGMQSGCPCQNQVMKK